MYPHTSGKGNGAEKMPRWCYFHLEICLPFNMLLLLLSHFSRVRLCATPQTAAHQAPLSLGFSRQEHWSGLPFPSPIHESEKWKWSRSVVSNSLKPHGLLPGYSVHGIFQARVLEWVAIAFSARGSSQPNYQTGVCCSGRRILYHSATWEGPSFSYSYMKRKI